MLDKETKQNFLNYSVILADKQTQLCFVVLPLEHVLWNLSFHPFRLKKKKSFSLQWLSCFYSLKTKCLTGQLMDPGVFCWLCTESLISEEAVAASAGLRLCLAFIKSLNSTKSLYTKQNNIECQTKCHPAYLLHPLWNKNTWQPIGAHSFYAL